MGQQIVGRLPACRRTVSRRTGARTETKRPPARGGGASFQRRPIRPVEPGESRVREAQLAHPELAEIPVVVVTAAGTLKKPIDARQILRKPFRIEELVRVVTGQS